ncbi:DUF4328 domain-containing protein [Sphingomonas sp. CGMCC 1.13654]|uniref:DUF4328 domain-containing protein n=1 Tax=Sphingomonas chungangi TaxID=2683589 RepID=A0A838L0U4_9SPHN|nr:DUF4328 domain-containing protein [Sphingomonas chungangi]MBA2932824.1 DUF4328 domain-containing protein [Sphingomonas chungangi]MVW56446.1 DUF4328 domain-containing protein [Sphingomonas chungangi]
MDEIRDPGPIGRQAVIWTWIWLAGEIGSGSAGLALALFYPPGADPGDADPSTLAGRLLAAMGILTVVSFLLFVVAAVLSCIWIFRMTAVKRALANAPSMTPGWAVGWFFIPIANLFKPFDGIREAWQVAAGAGDWPSVPTPMLLRVWWALWLGWTILDNIIARIENALIETGWLLALSGAIAVPLAILWMRIVRHITAAQAIQRDATAFL